ncbi:MAG: YiiX/YebB-like N1pC/P60 family cysteine hydrolase [Gemmatimonadetes bacterium]|nr:YiiX/YebB-like N1pC/P60 family cysteine hydrolase [Gemmatimonadota bacterium]
MRKSSIDTSRARPIATGLVVVLCGLLVIPEPPPPPPPPTPARPFLWNQDEVWLALEQRFREARALGCLGLRAPIDSGLELGGQLLAHLAQRHVGPDAPILDSIEHNAFALASLVAGCLERLPEYVHLVTGTRSAVKRQSERWDLETAKDRLYRLLFGGRAALEEVMLQAPPETVPALVLGDEEPSWTPSTQMLGVTIHSGDLLVSRGGAPVAALIAVGNDYQGNFSHVSLVHVDETTGRPSVIESKQRGGVQVSSIEDYLNSVKLRVMILRPRADLPAMIADPMLPHRAAALALDRARRRDTPYDFAMDHQDDSRMYCSEVPAWAYRQLGIRLWMDISRISAPGTRRWLADLGVKRFDAQEPSDLEYDPQLRVVAEWRDPHTLYMDHIDNVVTEAMLGGAARGDRLAHRWYVLPVVRVLKGYSTVLNAFGKSGPVPQGLSATVAARFFALDHRHTEIKRRVLVMAEEFQARIGYTPPEWQLVRMAKQARDETR